MQDHNTMTVNVVTACADVPIIINLQVQPRRDVVRNDQNDDNSSFTKYRSPNPPESVLQSLHRRVLRVPQDLHLKGLYLSLRVLREL